MSLLPLTIKVCAETIGLDLVPFKPMTSLTKEMIEERKRVMRKRKLCVLMGKGVWGKFGELPHEEHAQNGIDLMYLYYNYVQKIKKAT